MNRIGSCISVGGRHSQADGTTIFWHCHGTCTGYRSRCIIGPCLYVHRRHRWINLQNILCSKGIEAFRTAAIYRDSIQKIVSIFCVRRSGNSLLWHILVHRNLEDKRRIQHFFCISCLKGYRFCRRSLYARHILMAIISISAIYHIKLM